MTGNVLAIAGSAFTYSVLRTPPAVTNPILWSYLGGSLAQSQNLVGTALTNIGAGPLYPPPGNYARFAQGTAALELPVADTGGSVTVMAVARTIDPSGVTSVISNMITATGNTGVDVELGSNYGISAYLGGAVSLPILTLPDRATNFKFYAVALQMGTGAQLYCMTDNRSQTATGTITRVPSAANWQLGQNPQRTNESTHIDLAFAGVCMSYLDGAAVANVYQSVKEALALTGMRI